MESRIAGASTGAVSASSSEPAYAQAVRPDLEQLVSDMAVTGAVVLVRSPEHGSWTTTIGTRTWRGSEPVLLADHFRVGSNTKTWTGTVILQLVDEGRTGLDDPVSVYRPDVPNGENITIAQLLDMSSGLSNYSTKLELNEQQDTNPSRAWTPEELLVMGLAEPPAFPPGEGFLYSNTNYVLLGLIIEQVTGVPVAQAFEKRIFDRLGLTESSFPALADASIPDPHPQTYTFGTNVETIDSNVLSPEVQEGARELPGTNSFMGHDPAEDITVVTWASTATDGRDPAVEFAKAVIAELYAD